MHNVIYNLSIYREGQTSRAAETHRPLPTRKVHQGLEALNKSEGVTTYMDGIQFHLMTDDLGHLVGFSRCREKPQHCL